MRLLDKNSVLVADDYEINIQVLKLTLEKFGIIPDVAGDGEQALDMYRDKNYNLIFMDLMMPKMNGYEATEKIREYEKEKGLDAAVIIAVSANYLDDTVSNLSKSGFDGMLPKPYNVAALEKTLKKYFQI
jgi:CheY-like chemotaxis protein